MALFYLEWLNEAMQQVNFSAEKINAVINLYKKICDDEKASRIFHSTIALYENGFSCDFKSITENIDFCIEKISGEHKFTGHLLAVLTMAKHTKEIYKNKKLTVEGFQGILNDLKVKSDECFANYGVVGISNLPWYERFLNCTRYVLGRLQFEPNIFKWDDVEINGCWLKKGDTVISVHIPGGEKLQKEDCIESFLMAEEFFKGIKKDGALPFSCISWLLHPSLREVLPEGSNILQFSEFFRCVYSAEQEENLVRIFGRVDFKNKENLPEKTSLQRAYKKYLLKGGNIGIGVGYFFIKDKKFIK